MTESSTNSISLLNNHLEKGSCPKTLRYNARVNITPDEDFKKDINSIREKAEQALVGGLVKFHYRRLDRLKNKYRKLKQAQSRRSYQEANQSFRNAPSRNRNTSEGKIENELAEVLKAKIREVDTLLEQMRAQANNKKSEFYPVVLSYPLEIREGGRRNRADNKAVKSRKRIEWRKVKEKKRFLNNIKSRNQHIKNLSKFTAVRRANYVTIPWFKVHSHSRDKRKPGASYSMTLVNLSEECALNTYFTVKIKNLILSTLSQTGTHQSSPQLLLRPS